MMNSRTTVRAAAVRPRASAFGSLAGMLLLLLTHALLPGPAAAQSAPGVVYTMTNATAGNAIVIYNRAADGTLSLAGMVPTGGAGTGGGLENQGGLVLTNDNRWLFAVNAGSNGVSSFAVGSQGLTLVDRVPSGGERPVSLTARGNQLYVLNAGAVNNITGFTRSATVAR
jgi:6-phosphogluconolactonase